MSFVTSGRVSLGGLRTGTIPLGKSTFRKNTASRRFPALMPSAHFVSSACAAKNPPIAMAAAATRALGKNFNFHLPATDVVRKILGRYHHFVAPRRERRGYQQFAG